MFLILGLNLVLLAQEVPQAGGNTNAGLVTRQVALPNPNDRLCRSDSIPGPRQRSASAERNEPAHCRSETGSLRADKKKEEGAFERGSREAAAMDIAPLHQAPLTLAPTVAPADPPAGNLELVQAVHAVNAAELYGEDSELSLVLDRRTRRAAARLVHRKTRLPIRDIAADEVLALAESLGRAGSPLE